MFKRLPLYVRPPDDLTDDANDFRDLLSEAILTPVQRSRHPHFSTQLSPLSIRQSRALRGLSRKLIMPSSFNTLLTKLSHALHVDTDGSLVCRYSKLKKAYWTKLSDANKRGFAFQMPPEYVPIVSPSLEIIDLESGSRRKEEIINFLNAYIQDKIPEQPRFFCFGTFPKPTLSIKTDISSFMDDKKSIFSITSSDRLKQFFSTFGAYSSSFNWSDFVVFALDTYFDKFPDAKIPIFGYSNLTQFVHPPCPPLEYGIQSYNELMEKITANNSSDSATQILDILAGCVAELSSMDPDQRQSHLHHLLKKNLLFQTLSQNNPHVTDGLITLSVLRSADPNGQRFVPSSNDRAARQLFPGNNPHQPGIPSLDLSNLGQSEGVFANQVKAFFGNDDGKVAEFFVYLSVISEKLNGSTSHQQPAVVSSTPLPDQDRSLDASFDHNDSALLVPEPHEPISVLSRLSEILVPITSVNLLGNQVSNPRIPLDSVDHFKTFIATAHSHTADRNTARDLRAQLSSPTAAYSSLYQSIQENSIENLLEKLSNLIHSHLPPTASGLSPSNNDTPAPPVRGHADNSRPVIVSSTTSVSYRRTPSPLTPPSAAAATSNGHVSGTLGPPEILPQPPSAPATASNGHVSELAVGTPLPPADNQYRNGSRIRAPRNKHDVQPSASAAASSNHSSGNGTTSNRNGQVSHHVVSRAFDDVKKSTPTAPPFTSPQRRAQKIKEHKKQTQGINVLSPASHISIKLLGKPRTKDEQPPLPSPHTNFPGVTAP